MAPNIGIWSIIEGNLPLTMQHIYGIRTSILSPVPRTEAGAITFHEAEHFQTAQRPRNNKSDHIFRLAWHARDRRA